MYSLVNTVIDQRAELLNSDGGALVKFNATNHVISSYLPVVLQIPLDVGREYHINRIYLTINNFQDFNNTVYAFPEYEQFSFVVSMKATVKSDVLFNQMVLNSNNGSKTEVWKESFVFRTDSNADNNLLLTLTPGSGALLGFVSIVVPGSVYYVNGLITFEGFSYDFATAAKLSAKAKQDSGLKTI